MTQESHHHHHHHHHYHYKSFIITLIIFVKNPPVNFASALLDIGNDSLILYEKVNLFLFNYVINSQGIPTVNSAEDYTAGDHVAAAWLIDDSNKYGWHRGIVETVTEDCLHISYFQRASKDATRWNFPEVENVYPTCQTQILCTLKNFGYHSGARILCTISKDQAAHAEKNLIIFVKNIT